MNSRVLLTLFFCLNAVIAFRSPLISLKSKSNSVDDPVKDDGYALAVQIEIGTRPQKFKMAVSTTFADTWVADRTCRYESGCKPSCSTHCMSFECEGCCEYSECPIKIRFDSEKSKTYQSKGQNWTYENSLSGFIGSDVITLTGTGITIQSATFVQANALGDPVCSNCDDVSGIFGLAISETNKSSLFEQAVQSGAVENSQIGIWMNKTFDSTTGDTIGELTFAGYDQVKCPGSLLSVPLTGSDWRFTLTGGIAGKYQISDEWTTVLSPDFYTIDLPGDLYDNLYKSINAYYDDELENDVADCNQDVQLTLKVNDADIVLEFTDYTTRIGDVCALDVMSLQYLPTDDNVILGSRFLNAYCAIVDAKTQLISFTRVVS
ncbi:hypothetical protein M3Y94_00881100 [Aphelenchoides besseyi]|nr:hypothetical protein M3Y94_00881100 [Aphelenchoides besseyi]KAI6216749.1 hypothetical protein M3Y95_01260800 [Aphelenchoides besseyi]